MWNLHVGMECTSAVTVLFIPKFAKLPLTKPQVNATNCNETFNTLVIPWTRRNKTEWVQYLRCIFQILWSIGQIGKKSKWVILKHINALMICPKIVYLLFVNWCPKIGTNEFHCVQFILETRIFSCQSLNQTIASWISKIFQSGQIIFLSELKQCLATHFNKWWWPGNVVLIICQQHLPCSLWCRPLTLNVVTRKQFQPTFCDSIYLTKWF